MKAEFSSNDIVINVQDRGLMNLCLDGGYLSRNNSNEYNIWCSNFNGEYHVELELISYLGHRKYNNGSYIFRCGNSIYDAACVCAALEIISHKAVSECENRKDNFRKQFSVIVHDNNGTQIPRIAATVPVTEYLRFHANDEFGYNYDYAKITNKPPLVMAGKVAKVR